MLRWLIIAISLCALACETYKGKLEFFKALSFVVNMSQDDLSLLQKCEAHSDTQPSRECKRLYKKRKKNTRRFDAGAYMAHVESTNNEVKFKIFSVGRKKPQKFSLGVPKEFFWGESEFELPAYMSGLPFDVYGQVEVLENERGAPVSEWETCTRMVPYYSCYTIRQPLPPNYCRWPPCFTWRRVCGTRYRTSWGQRWVSYQRERVRKKLYVEFQDATDYQPPQSRDTSKPVNDTNEAIGQFEGRYADERKIYSHQGYCQWGGGMYPYY